MGLLATPAKVLAGSSICFVLMLTGCMTGENDPAQASPKAQVETHGKDAFSATAAKLPGYMNNARGTSKPGSLYGMPILYEEVDGQALFQGDIILSERQLQAPALAKTAGSGKPTSFERWPNNTVYYEIDSTLPAEQQEWIEEDLIDIAGITPVIFIKHGTEKDYIRFVKSPNACSSPVGRQGLMQPVNLAGFCDAGSIYHEIFHALGMWHEQSRSDRDEYITVDYGNLANDIAWRMNWDKYSFNSGFDFGPFDFNSIMLYDSYAGAVDPYHAVMQRKDGTTWKSNHDFPSQGDLSSILAMYPSEGAAPFKARDIGVGANGSVFKVSMSRDSVTKEFRIYEYDSLSNTWVLFPGPGGARIDVDPAGRPWVTQASGKVLHWTGTEWSEAAGLVQAVDIGIGAEGSVFALSKQAVQGANATLWKWNGSGWSMVPGGAGLRVSVDEAGNPWTVNDQGVISHLADGGWQNLYFPFGSGGKDIGIGKDGTVYVVGGEQSGSDFRLYQKAGPATQNGPGLATFFCVGSVLGVNVDALGKASAWISRADQSTEYILQ
jgi:hypothetical protein